VDIAAATHRAAGFTEGTLRVATGSLGDLPAMGMGAITAVMAAAITGMVGAAIEADGTGDTAVSASVSVGITPGLTGAVTIPDITTTGTMMTPIMVMVLTPPTVPTPMLPMLMLRMATTEEARPHIIAGAGTGIVTVQGGMFMHRGMSMHRAELMHRRVLMRQRVLMPRRVLMPPRELLPKTVNGTASVVTDEQVMEWPKPTGSAKPQVERALRARC
jgi:hypothetical protein